MRAIHQEDVWWSLKGPLRSILALVWMEVFDVECHRLHLVLSDHLMTAEGRDQ